MEQLLESSSHDKINFKNRFDLTKNVFHILLSGAQNNVSNIVQAFQHIWRMSVVLLMV